MSPKRSRIKLVVPPNLLKQENVCLIPRELEHPSYFDFQEKNYLPAVDIKFFTEKPGRASTC